MDSRDTSRDKVGIIGMNIGIIGMKSRIIGILVEIK